MPNRIQILRVAKVYSLDELRSIRADVAPGLEAILLPSKKRYLFNTSSRADDDGDKVIAPSAAPVGCCTGGRWELEFIPVISVVPQGLRVARLDFSGGPGDYVVPTGFTPRLVIVSAVVQYNANIGATSLGMATGIAAGEQSVITNAEADNTQFTSKYQTIDSIIVLSSPVGGFGGTVAAVVQMDATQVKVTISAGSASFTVTVLG